MARRSDGELEREIMQVLWAQQVPMPPSEVRAHTRGDLAYTSVATVLIRLWEKGLVRRHQSGRAYAYEPAISREEWYSNKLNAVLAEAPNHRDLLAGFVGRLSKRDLVELRNLLAERDK